MLDSVLLKENVKPVEQGWDVLLLLQPITFNYVNDLKKEIRYGLSAQDVQKVIPDLVNQDTEGYLTIDYIGLIPIIVQALKDQNTQIEQLKSLLQKSHLRNVINSYNNNVREYNDIKANVLYQISPSPYNKINQITNFKTVSSIV